MTRMSRIRMKEHNERVAMKKLIRNIMIVLIFSTFLALIVGWWTLISSRDMSDDNYRMYQEMRVQRRGGRSFFGRRRKRHRYMLDDVLSGGRLDHFRDRDSSEFLPEHARSMSEVDLVLS